MQSALEGRHKWINNKEIVENLTIVEGSVRDLIVEDGECLGIYTGKEGTQEKILSKSVILTTGTFLGGRIHIGRETREAGRMIR